MILRLDPRRPLVWRSPHSLQFGNDPVLAVLNDVSDGDARLIDALCAGITRASLGTLAGQAGVAPHRVDEVLSIVTPALESPRHSTSMPAPVAVVGRGVAAARVAGVVGEAGHPVALGESIERVGGRRPRVAVLVSGHVIDPHEHVRWLRRDIAHVPVVFGEVAITVGPLVVPGVSACLTCVERERVDADPARTAVASQLWGRGAPTETPAHATEAAIEVVRMLRLLDSGVDPHALHIVRLDGERAKRAEQVWSTPASCGCHDLSSSSVRALRREIDSGFAQHAPTRPAVPTRVRAHAERA